MPSAEDLLINIENFAMVIGDVLIATSSSDNTATANKTITRENIGNYCKSTTRKQCVPAA